jgi:hypothetical protein
VELHNEAVKKIVVGELEGHYLSSPGVDGRKILKWLLKTV